MATVILYKGQDREKRWEHDDRASALRRADSLAELHGSKVIDNGGDIFSVDASAYYKRDGEKLP
jgi:hypothetical protein